MRGETTSDAITRWWFQIFFIFIPTLLVGKGHQHLTQRKMQEIYYCLGRHRCFGAKKGLPPILFGKIPILTHIFQMGWFNHQPDKLELISFWLWACPCRRRQPIPTKSIGKDLPPGKKSYIPGTPFVGPYFLRQLGNPYNQQLITLKDRAFPTAFQV